MDVHLKRGPSHDPGWQAWVLDLHGFGTWAPSEEDVLARLPGKVEAYLAWLRLHGDTPPSVEGAVHVAERVEGDEVLFDRDRGAATQEEIWRTALLLRWSREDLLAALDAVPPAAFDWDPPYRWFPAWAAWRTIREITAHVARTETGYYLHWIGYRPRTQRATGDIGTLLRETRARTLRFLERLESARDRVRLATRGGEAWTVRKALRRLVWHELMHARSIRRITEDYRRTVG